MSKKNKLKAVSILTTLILIVFLIFLLTTKEFPYTCWIDWYFGGPTVSDLCGGSGPGG